jgi:hypothetical protein
MPYNAFDQNYSSGNTSNGGGYFLGSASGLPLTSGKPLDQEVDRASSFTDRFGDWNQTSAGTMPAEASGALGAPAPGSAGAVAPENIRRLTRVDGSNAANAFTSGSAPVPYLQSPEFDDRFGNWIMPPIDRQPSRASRPIGAFTAEPSYSIPPPIWGPDDRAKRGAEEWFSRWIEPFLRQQ